MDEQLEFSVVPNGPVSPESSSDGPYPTDEHGCLKIEGIYTGPMPKNDSNGYSQKNSSYEVTNPGNLMDPSNVYTGPQPQLPENPNQRNTSYEVNNLGTMVAEDGLYTGPDPRVNLVNQSTKNNSHYTVSDNGSFLDESHIYSGPKPNETSEAKAALKVYDAKERAKKDDYDELKKKQRRNLRHSGYKYKPVCTIFTNS